MSLHEWIFWAFILMGQNFAFTFVSRARNSGSLKRHMIASVFSNGIWFVSQLIIFTAMFQMMLGKYGLGMQVFTGVYYTSFTILGSILAHYFSLKNEKGKGAVGANKKYAQIPVAEWEKFKAHTLQLLSFTELQKWALENGHSGETDQQAFEAWRAAHPRRCSVLHSEPVAARPGQGARI